MNFIRFTAGFMLFGASVALVGPVLAWQAEEEANARKMKSLGTECDKGDSMACSSLHIRREEAKQIEREKRFDEAQTIMKNTRTMQGRLDDKQSYARKRRIDAMQRNKQQYQDYLDRKAIVDGRKVDDDYLRKHKAALKDLEAGQRKDKLTKEAE